MYLRKCCVLSLVLLIVTLIIIYTMLYPTCNTFALQTRINWLDLKTKNKALKKAMAMKSLVGYPNILLNDKILEDHYKKLEIDPDEYYNSKLNITIYQYDNSMDRLRKSVKTSDWLLRRAFAETNAYYFQEDNSMVFPAALLQGAFFNNNRPRYMNYGSIGYVIGHEITHSFNDHGKADDYEGDVNWYEQETNEKYQEKAECIIRQYNNYIVEETGMYVNGYLTLGENIADIGGTKLAYLANKEWIKRNGPAPKLFGLDFTTSQIFWISAAQPWCTKERPRRGEPLILYSPSEFRVDWMDPKTKKHALHKAEAMETHIAYPDEILDDKKLEDLYEKLEVNPDEYYNSRLNIRIYKYDYSMDRLRKPVNKFDWASRPSPVLINAFYNTRENSIEFLTGILQGVFFNNNRPQCMNYGSIGAIIGHEITHGFDDSGKQYDYKGDLFNWWEPETEEKFEAKANCIIDQYYHYIVEEVGMNLNPVNTLGENIAENGGIKIAYYAYKEWIKRNGPENKLPGLDFTPSQLFWMNSAQTWCTKHTRDFLKVVIFNDPHSPAEFRVNGAFSNQVEFVEDFNCPAGSNMNRDKKCQIW